MSRRSGQQKTPAPPPGSSPPDAAGARSADDLKAAYGGTSAEQQACRIRLRAPADETSTVTSSAHRRSSYCLN